ncbi:MAG: hypothetical protein IPJ34_31765 [Myxococcales bacterium]|nr:hypothetical protein [Myxococcales bacterium]
MASRFPWLRPLLFAPVPLLALLATPSCSKGEEEPENPLTETGTDTAAGDTPVGDGDAADGPTDTPTDTPPPPITCKKGPAFAPALRVNHNVDNLRNVARAGMIQLDANTIVVAMLEAIDTSARHAIWVRTVDVNTGKIADDERLDVDADGLKSDSQLAIGLVRGGAVAVGWGNGGLTHYRLLVKGKWSPDVATAFPGLAGTDSVAALQASTGQLLVVRTSDALNQAVVYKPDEGPKGTFTTTQDLALDGGSGRATVDLFGFDDGRFGVMVWQGAGGPSMRLRSLSGAWTAAGAKAELGALGSSPQYRMLADGSIVLVALEGTGELRKVVTSTWTATDGWLSARLLSKVTVDGNGVVPASPGLVLYPVSATEVEYAAWTGACAAGTLAKDCQFKAITRSYTGGAWKDPVDQKLGADRNDAIGLGAVMLGDGSPLFFKVAEDKFSAVLKARVGKVWSDSVDLTGGSPLFGDPVTLSPAFYGGAAGLYSLTARQSKSGATTTTVTTALGRIDLTKKTVTWDPVLAGTYELRNLPGDMYPYVDGAGGFTVGANSAVDGAKTAPILAHNNAGSLEAFVVVASDESGGFFTHVPSGVGDGTHRSAIYVASVAPTDTSGGPGRRLRAYAWNGIGSGVPKLLANESRSPRPFGGLSFGCGGAVLYAVDPVDGSHALELVFVREGT